MAGLFDRIAGWLRDQKSTALESLPPFMRYPETRTGYNVSALRSLDVSTVLACARVIAQGVAQVPIRFYRVGPDGRSQRLRAHPLMDVICRRPNPWQTSYEYRETLALHLVLCGNHFAFKNVVNGRVIELIPLEPANVLVDQKRDLSIEYQVTFKDGSYRVLGPDQIWHVRGPSWNSWMGLEAVKLAREAIGLAIATEAAHADLHKNGVQASGIYTVADKLPPADYKVLRDWIVANTSADNRYMPLILDRGAKFERLTMTGVDAQHLETRKFQIEEICRSFGVNPIMVGYSDKTATYASAEQMFIAHVVHTLMPWYERLEDSIQVNLLAGEPDIEVEFFAESLMRGAAKERADYYSKALGSGGSPAWMTQNEVREATGLDRIDDDDADALPKGAMSEAGPAADPGEDPDDG